MSPLPDNDAYRGLQRLFSGTDERNALDFIVRLTLGQAATATLVQVVEVTPPADPVGDVGNVDVKPMVAQIDGAGNATPHGIIYGVPYFRLQGGTNAVIMDPKPGDIGLAVFASRDISSVKSTKAPANPGSRRQFDMADALYVGGFLNGTPTQYVRFSDDGIDLVSPTAVTITAPQATIDGPLHLTGQLTADAGATFADDVVADGISVSTHKHGGVTTGAGQTGVPV